MNLSSKYNIVYTIEKRINKTKKITMVWNTKKNSFELKKHWQTKILESVGSLMLEDLDLSTPIT